jgi:hypothetical protein
MRTYELVKFNCTACGEALETKDYTTGQLVSCPCCAKEMALDVREPPEQNAPRSRGSDDQAVPIRMGLGKAASFETTVSRKDAGRMGHTFLGGILVALGVILCATLGLNLPKRS